MPESNDRERACRALIIDRDLSCCNCRGLLIAGYVDLVAACGSVPMFKEMALPCLRCNVVNYVDVNEHLSAFAPFTSLSDKLPTAA